MPEEKLLFVEKELNRWKRPESPKPGTTLVFVGNGNPSLVVSEGERIPTQGELFLGKYSTYYEVDMGDRSLHFHERIPCADAFEFQAEVKLTYAVSDPALIIRRARLDSGQFLKDLAIDVMRSTSRRFRHEQSGEAENSIASRIEDEVRDEGFKLKNRRSAFIKLSLDEAVQSRLITRQLSNYDFQDIKTQVSRETELSQLQTELSQLKQEAKLSLKGRRAEFFAPLIKSGDWATLLAMLDPTDPEDEAIRAMIEATLTQQKIQNEKQQKMYEKQQKMFEIAIEKGALEGWQLQEVAKALFKDLSGLSEQSVAFLEGKSESQDTSDSKQTKNVTPNVPDEVSRDQDD